MIDSRMWNNNEECFAILCNTLSECELVSIISTNWKWIRHLKKPHETICLAAIKTDEKSLYYISDPSKEVCLAAVKQDGTSIHYIKNPSEEVCLAAVDQDEKAIMYIHHPSLELLRYAKKSLIKSGYYNRYVQLKNKHYKSLEKL